jgi:hypothetical protein
MILVDRGQYGNDAQMRDAMGDARPLVDAPRSFHQQRLGGNARDSLRRRVGDWPLDEREEAFLP